MTARDEQSELFEIEVADEFKLIPIKQFRWILPIVLWDVVLPFSVLALFQLLQIVVPLNQQDSLVFVSWFLAFACGLVRAHMATLQIEKACNGRKPFYRQIAVVFAIVLLLIAEIATSFLMGVKNLPPEVFLQVGSLVVIVYFLYLGFIVIALRPSAELE